MLTNLASVLGLPWTSDGPARCLPHTFRSHLPPSSSHTMASTVIRCPGPCPEPRERRKKRRKPLGWAHSLSSPGPGTAPCRDPRIQTPNNPLAHCHLVQHLRRNRGIERYTMTAGDLTTPTSILTSFLIPGGGPCSLEGVGGRGAEPWA